MKFTDWLGLSQVNAINLLIAWNIVLTLTIAFLAGYRW